jgi:hypothetical protein
MQRSRCRSRPRKGIAIDARLPFEHAALQISIVGIYHSTPKFGRILHLEASGSEYLQNSSRRG